MRIFLFALLLLSQTVGADFTVPALTGPVVDTAGLLHSTTKEQLDNFLRNLHDQGGAQIQVAALPDLNGLSIEEASIKITDAWKLGKKKEDRGVLLTFAVAEHKIRIEVGQGLEGDLPDVIANRIIREVIAPRMRAGSPDRAVIDGVMAIAHYTDPTLVESAEESRVRSQPRGNDWEGTFWAIVIFGFFTVYFILPIFSRRWRQRLYSGGGGGGFFGGGWGGGGFGGGGWGGGFGGGGGGGGWSGGGGGFSGGGSSGSW